MESVLREVFQLHQIDVEVSSRNIQQLLHQRLSALAISATEQQTIDESQNINNDVRKLEGRLGPLSAGLNKQSACGVVKYSQNDLEIESHSNFCSIRGNVCLFKGKWMYEVVLGTSGIQQIGWTQLDSPFTNEEGVGDSPDSYAYDGKRIKKWSVQSQNYGSQWVAGDVIGCCIDLDQGQIHFSRNGSSLGAAFSNIKVGERGIGLSYFPGLSLSHGERALLNFGAKPFIYPVEGYQPIHIFDYNLHVASSQAGYLLQSLNRLLMIHIKSREYQTSELRCKSSDLISIGANILSFLMPLITKEYILQSAFYPFLMDLFRNGGNSDGSPLIVFLNLLLATVSDNDLQDIFGELFEVLSLHHRTASYTNYFSTSKTNNNITHGNNILADLQLTLTLLKIPTLLRKLIVHPNFSDLLEKFFIRKPLSKDDLSSVIPLVWWQNAEEEGCSKEAMDESVSTITKIMEKHESYLFDLFAIFALNNTSVTIMTGNERVVVSVQNVFRQWLRSLVKKNKGANRNIAPPGLSDPSAIVNLFFCMVNYLSPLQENSNNMVPRLEPKMFPPTMFYDERALEYFDFPRIGGLLGHLQKTFPLPSPLQPVEIPFEVELFDDMTYFHHLIISIAFKNASAILQSQNSAITQLDDTNKRIKRAQEMNQTEGVEHLTTAKKVFRDDACDLIRQSTWNRQILFSRWKQEGMFQLMALQMNILEYFSREQPTDYEAVFNYVPESYIDTFIDMFHALRRGDPPFSFVATESRMQIFCKVINTLSSQFVDKRIINPDIRDLMLQSLSVLLQYQEFVRVFESPLVDKEKFLENLLSSFDARFWIPISNILLRFWKDCGFAQALKPNELQVVSKEYRKVFRDVCTKNQGLLNDWLNKVFNNLNWAITEFGVAAKDLQAALPRHIAPELQQHQRKVNVMFELSVTLAKLLEFVSLELPETFLNPAVGQELNINRLAELLLFILNRCTVGTEAKLFQDLLKVNMIALDKVNRASILAPVVGTIVNLQQSLGEQKEAKYKLVPVIVSTGFSKDTFEFLLTVDWSAKGAASENMTEYDGLAAKLETLKGFIVELQSESSKIEDKERSLTRSDSSDFCSICCSAPVDTRFEPCHHRSCYKCIKRHLLNNKKCFFCNTPITNIVLETNNNANETVE